MNEVLDQNWCDPEKGNARPEMAIGASSLEYEHTVPTKFLIGSERGRFCLQNCEIVNA
jgi:hypothetical protein